MADNSFLSIMLSLVQNSRKQRFYFALFFPFLPILTTKAIKKYCGSPMNSHVVFNYDSYTYNYKNVTWFSILVFVFQLQAVRKHFFKNNAFKHDCESQ